MQSPAQELQAELLLGRVEPIVVPTTPVPSLTVPLERGTAPAARSPRVVRKPVQILPTGVYERLKGTIGQGAVVGIAILLWWLGAFYSLQFLQALDISVDHLGIAQWLIPIAITGIELALWPRRGTHPLLMSVFMAVALFDIGSSSAGLFTWAAGRTVPLFGGITIPSSGAGAWVVCIGISLVFAFGPEKLVRVASGELYRLYDPKEGA